MSADEGESGYFSIRDKTAGELGLTATRWSTEGETLIEDAPSSETLWWSPSERVVFHEDGSGGYVVEDGVLVDQLPGDAVRLVPTTEAAPGHAAVIRRELVEQRDGLEDATGPSASPMRRALTWAIGMVDRVAGPAALEDPATGGDLAAPASPAVVRDVVDAAEVDRVVRASFGEHVAAVDQPIAWRAVRAVLDTVPAAGVREAHPTALERAADDLAAKAGDWHGYAFADQINAVLTEARRRMTTSTPLVGEDDDSDRSVAASVRRLRAVAPRLRVRSSFLSDLERMLGAVEEPVAPDRCASCEHGRGHHPADGTGCWYTVTTARRGYAAGCNCREYIAATPRVEGEAPAGESRAPLGLTEHDRDMIEWLLALSPGECKQHDFAVFTDGGVAPPCPWCHPLAPKAGSKAEGEPTEQRERADARAEIDGPFAAVWRAVATGMALGQYPSQVASAALSAIWDSAETVSGGDLIRAERLRQITDEDWSPEHDDQHTRGQLLTAALVYLGAQPLVAWPWSEATPRRGNRLDRLIKAGALIAAEVDRVRRGGAQVLAIGDELSTDDADARVPIRATVLELSTPPRVGYRTGVAEIGWQWTGEHGYRAPLATVRVLTLPEPGEQR